MYDEIELSPADIRFMQDSICRVFRCKRNVNETIEKIEKRILNVGALPQIQVLKKDGHYYSLDNRRLYIYRVLHYRGLLDTIKVNLVPSSRFQQWKFTTYNEGKTIYVRGGKTHKHYEERPPPPTSSTTKNVSSTTNKNVSRIKKNVENWKDKLSSKCWHVSFSITKEDLDLIATQFNRIVCLNVKDIYDEIDILAIQFSQKLRLN